MKKTCFNKIKLFFSYFVLLACLLFFSNSCGLDTFEIIEPPYYIIHKPEVNEPVTEGLFIPQQYSERYFVFFSRDADNLLHSGIKFLGTDVYYKIYNDYEKMSSERAYLNTISTSESISSNLIQTLEGDSSSGGYGFKKLKSTNFNGNVLIPASPIGQDQRIKIRLTDYNNDYKAEILVDNVPINNAIETIPMRNVEVNADRTFNFGRNGNYDKKPVSEDKDCYISSVDSNIYYVNLYAVSVGIDTTIIQHYSNIINIGSVIIDASVENN